LLKKLFSKSHTAQPENTLPVVVARKRQIADSVVELELRNPNGGEVPAFTAGSHIDLHISKDVVRQYSLANSPTDTDRYLCAVLIETDGTGGSKAVSEKVEEGTQLYVSAPRNHFALVEDAPFSLLIAGGIGVTPLLAMAYRLKELQAPFRFYYRARSRAAAAYAELLATEFGESVVCLFSDEGGREKFDLAAIVSAAPKGSHLYTCGGNDFMDVVTEAAKTQFSEDQIHLEHFHPAEIDSTEDKAFELYCEVSGVTLQVPADKSIVTVLEENGIDIPISCTEGVCGSCITKFTEGEVDHRDFVLSKAEREQKRLFTPCCSRARGKRLAMDI
jgi:vanillate monooxygenase ferredoxin subunit